MNAANAETLKPVAGWLAALGGVSVFAAVAVWFWLHTIAGLGILEAVGNFRELILADVVDEAALQEIDSERWPDDWMRAAEHLVEGGYSEVQFAGWVLGVFLLAHGTVCLWLAFCCRKNSQRNRVTDQKQNQGEY